MSRESKKGLIVLNWTFFDNLENVNEHDMAKALLAVLKERERQMEIVECCGIEGKKCIKTVYKAKKNR